MDPPILPLRPAQGIGQLSVPVFALGVDIGDLGIYRLIGPSEVAGTSGAAVSAFGSPEPFPSFSVEASWSRHDDQGVEIFADGIRIPQTNLGSIHDVFSSGELLSLKANRADRVTMRVDAQAGASTLPASAVALVDPIFSFAPGTAVGYAFRHSDRIGNTRSDPVPEPDLLALLGAGVIAIGLRRRSVSARGARRADGAAPSPSGRSSGESRARR